VRNAPPAEGGIEGGPDATLPPVMAPTKGFAVTRNCEDTSNGDVHEMAIQATRKGDGMAEIDGLKITYHVGDQKYVTRYPFAVLLCDPAEEPTPKDCRA
jgi:hypothetical protein